MSDASPTPSRRRWRHAWHLVWALPVGLVASFFMLFMSTLAWCGVSGCSGGGFGRISNPDVGAAVAFLLGAGVVAALPLGVIPWSRSTPTRWLVAAGYAAVVCFFGYAMIGP